jgi:hypothetical protein
MAVIFEENLSLQELSERYPNLPGSDMQIGFTYWNTADQVKGNLHFNYTDNAVEFLHIENEQTISSGLCEIEDTKHMLDDILGEMEATNQPEPKYYYGNVNQFTQQLQAFRTTSQKRFSGQIDPRFSRNLSKLSGEIMAGFVGETKVNNETFDVSVVINEENEWVSLDTNSQTAELGLKSTNLELVKNEFVDYLLLHKEIQENNEEFSENFGYENDDISVLDGENALDRTQIDYTDDYETTEKSKHSQEEAELDEFSEDFGDKQNLDGATVFDKFVEHQGLDIKTDSDYYWAKGLYQDPQTQSQYQKEVNSR